MSRNQYSVLELLVQPLTREQFLDENWRPQRPLVLHGDLERFGALPKIAEIKDRQSILAAYKGPVMAYGESMIEETEGLANRAMLPASQAARWFERGCTLEFDNAEMYIPAVHRWLDGLRRDLELPEGTFAKSIVYSSPRRSGLAPHFDAYVNFIVQLQGCKLWYLARNHNAISPMVHYDLDEQPFIPDELNSYWQGEAPTDFRAHAEIVELRPGSMLFLPRGYWHATEASEEVLSFNMTFSIPTWLDLALAEIRRRLVIHAHWRDTVDGCGSSDPARLDAVRRQASALLDRFADDLGRLGPDDVIAQQSQPHDIYQQASALFKQGLKL